MGGADGLGAQNFAKLLTHQAVHPHLVHHALAVIPRCPLRSLQGCSHECNYYHITQTHETHLSRLKQSCDLQFQALARLHVKISAYIKR